MAYKTLKTDAAFALEARAETTGSKIVLTQMALGDGGSQAYDPDQGQTALRGEKVRVTLNALCQKENAPAQWSAEGIFPADAGGFTAREAGLFTEDGTLFAVASIPPVYRPTAAEGAVGQFVLRLNFVPANAENITISIDPAGSLATQDYVQNYADRKINNAVAGYLPLSGGKLTGTIADNGQYSGGTAQSSVPDSTAYAALQLLGVQDQEFAGLSVYSPKTGQKRIFRFAPDGSVTDPDGNRLLTPDLGNSLFLSLSGGTVTGEVDISGSDGRGGVCASMMPDGPEKAYLQLQGKNSALAPVVVFFDGNGWKTWRFDPANGEITDPNGQALATRTDVANSARATQDWAKNNFLQLPAGSPPLKIQAFRVSSGPRNGSPRISFPEAFSQTLSVSAIVNQTPNSGTVSRTVNILPNANTNDIRLDNWGFNCQIFYALGGGGAGTTGDPWTMLVTAIGVA